MLRGQDGRALEESMLYLVAKAALSGAIIAIVSEVAQRRPGLGALIVSLPLVSILAIIWLWRDTGDMQRIAAHAEATFWLVLPTLPMFLVFPALLRSGIDFWVALVGACALTIVLYLLTIWVLPKLGISL
jgi:hypothetical protein